MDYQQTCGQAGTGQCAGISCRLRVIYPKAIESLRTAGMGGNVLGSDTICGGNG
jgi:hypothetical protein